MAADPKRDAPDYDGRGNADADADSWALWIPRLALSPLYLVNEYVVRRPLVGLVTIAEHAVGTDQLCAVDLARLSKAVPVDQFRYRVVEIGAGQRLELAATLAPDGLVCFRPRSLARSELADNASERRVIFEVRNGTAAGPLEIHTCDLGPRGMFVVGLNRRAQ